MEPPKAQKPQKENSSGVFRAFLAAKNLIV